jgi:hypothetical protein
LASQYAAAALQSRPKLKLHLQLDAPKVAIPAVDAKGRATLALDFGRFVIESGECCCCCYLLAVRSGVFRASNACELLLCGLAMQAYVRSWHPLCVYNLEQALPITQPVGSVTSAPADFKTQGTLPAEEAALYECVRLNVANVSAYVVDGEFDWQKRDDADAGQLLIPLLERTGMDIALQVGC